MLHVANGDTTAAVLREAGYGDALVWRDALLVGPARRALASLDDWAHRAKALAPLGIDPGAYLEGVRAFLRAFDAARDDDEVVLWFEEDLFCQLPLCYLLDRRGERGHSVSIVCPEEPLGPSKPARMDALFRAREPWSAERARLASRVWRAYGASEPGALVDLLREEFASWPMLRRGVVAHLARFPSLANGLGAPEDALLRLVAEGPTTFHDVFPRFNHSALGRVYGAGDHQAAWWLYQLATCETPLLRIEGLRAGDFARQTASAIAAWSLRVTTAGADVLAGRLDHARANPPTTWLGGVELTPGRPVWRWDAANETMVRA